MKLGIVGSEAAKFTLNTELEARATIALLIEGRCADTVISGACHLGGIDEWAIQEAKGLGCETLEFPSTTKQWSGPGGYAERNLRIAEASDLVVCITVSKLPEGYKGMRFPLCYHCKTDTHVKSGGCWTMKQAEKMGKETKLIII